MVGRVAQHGANNTEYFLGDALGSVRGLVDEEGELTLAKSYRPYGEVFSTNISGYSAYGFTSEWTDDYIKNIDLRSRWYSPQTGRFVSRDTWQGDYTRPNSLNKWNYSYSNPVRYTDPSGEDPIGECIAAFFALVFVDGPSPAGDVIGLTICAALLGASVSTLIAAQHADEFGQAVDT